MKPPPFEYCSPRTLDEALALLAESGDEAKVLAGGQSLLPLLGVRLARPARLVDVGRIPEMTALSVNGSVTLGGAVRQRTVERSPALATAHPLLAAALPLIGHAPIRNRGTVGGSVAHADPAAELPAVMLLANADLVLRSAARGERVVAAADFFEGFLLTAIRPDEILTQLRLPAWPAGAGASFREVARRAGDFALVGAAAVVKTDGSGGDRRFTDVRLGFIGVAGTPIRSLDAEQALVGQPVTDASIADAAALAAGALDPSSDIHASGAYRRHVAGVLARRVLQEAANAAR